jgi:hypothetical protein
MWNIKTKVILIMIREIETSLKLFIIYLSVLPENYGTRPLQITAILGTAHILGQVTQIVTTE